MLAKKYRFHGHGSLRYVYKNGDAVRTRLFTIKYTKNPMRHDSRYAVVVSKKVHKSAVGRNRIRRRLYELLRHQNEKVVSPHDVVVIISSGEVLAMDAHELEQQLSDALRQTTLYTSA